jgi:hypothetical protein
LSLCCLTPVDALAPVPFPSALGFLKSGSRAACAKCPYPAIEPFAVRIATEYPGSLSHLMDLVGALGDAPCAVHVSGPSDPAPVPSAPPATAALARGEGFLTTQGRTLLTPRGKVWQRERCMLCRRRPGLDTEWGFTSWGRGWGWDMLAMEGPWEWMSPSCCARAFPLTTPAACCAGARPCTRPTPPPPPPTPSWFI